MRLVTFYLLIFFSISTSAQISWQKIGTSPALGKINVLDYDATNNKLYAGTDNSGVFISSNGGSSWSAINSGIPIGQSVTDFGVTSTGVVYSAVGGIIYQLNNANSTWSMAYSSSNYISNANLIEQDQNGNILAFTKSQVYIAVPGSNSWAQANTGLGGVFGIASAKKGADGKFYMAWGNGVAQWNGSSWTQLSTNGLLQDLNYQSVGVATASSNGTIYAGGGNGILKYVSGSWTDISYNLPKVPYTASVTAPIRVNEMLIDTNGDIYITTQDVATGEWWGNVYKLINGTTNWLPQTGGLYNSIAKYNSLIKTSAGIYAAGFEGIFKTTDGGINWTLVTTGISAPVGIKSFDFLSDGRIVVATNTGHIYLGNATATTWTDITNKSTMSSWSIGHVRVDGNNTIYLSAGFAPPGLSTASAGLFYSKDLGQTWSKAFPADRGSLCDINISASNEILYGGMFDPAPDGKSIHYSNNGGTSWATISVNNGAAGSIFTANKDNNAFYAGSELGGALFSKNSGLSFQSIGNTTGVGGNVVRLDIAPWGDLFVSYDYNKGMKVVPAAQLSTASPLAATLSNFNQSSAGVYFNPSDVAFGNTNNLYVATDNAFLSSADNGQSFITGNGGLNQTKILRICVNKIDGYLYLANAEGLFKSTTQVISVSGGPAAPTLTITQPTCALPTGTITVTMQNVGDTYSFDNGNTFQASNVKSGLAPNTYYVKVKNGSSTSTATTAVVNPVPNSPGIPVVNVTQPTCLVATGTITVTIQNASDTYSFDNGASFQASNTKSGVISGSYQIVIKNQSGCVSAPKTAPINVAPVVPTTPVVSIIQPNCALSTGTVTITMQNAGETYSFDNGTSFQASNTKAGLDPGTYKVIIKSQQGCASVTTDVVITAFAGAPLAPVISITQPTCSVSTASISVTVQNATDTYSFDGGTSFQSANSKAGIAQGVYQILIKNQSGCVSPSTPATVNVQPTAPAQPTISLSVADPTHPVLTASPSSAYQWYKDGVIINGATSSTYAATGVGAYTVVVFSSGGCASVPSAPQNIVITAIEPTSGEEIQLYPNPVEENFMITFGEAAPRKISIYNSMGCLVESDTANNKQYTKDVSTYPTGMYVVRIATGSSTQAFKFVKR